MGNKRKHQKPQENNSFYKQQNQMNETTAKSENDFKATSDGLEVGNSDDEKVVGAKVREAEGLSLGANVRSAVVVILVGARVGDLFGDFVGERVGDSVGALEFSEGELVGAAVGASEGTAI